MSWMLMQVYHEIVENAAFGSVMAFDTIIRFLELEQSFERHTHKRPQGRPLGRLLRLMLNNYCAGRTSKNKVREWYADEPALQEELKLDAAELGEQDGYRPLDYLDKRAQTAILNDCLAILVTEFGLDLSLLYEDTSSSYFEWEKVPWAVGDTAVIIVLTVHRSTMMSVFWVVVFLPGWVFMVAQCLTTE